MKYRIPNLQACDLYQVKDGEVVSSGLSLKHIGVDGTLKNSRWLYTAMFNESILCDRFEYLVDRGDIVEKSKAVFPRKTKNVKALYTNQIIQLKFDYSLHKETTEERKKRKKEKTSAPPTFLSVKDIRKKVYEEGFDIDGVHYVRWMRSSGSARVGKVLFINEVLRNKMNKLSDASVKLENAVDLASYEAYRSLLLSTKIDYVKIKPENILLIDDFDSEFMEKCNVTEIIDGHLSTKTKDVKVKNSIWDGQSLIDPSIMGEYSDKGMILLRHIMFKSCCFNSNIQQWFADNGITDVSQLNGKTIAKDIKDIKLITTPSSIKYKKFGGKNWFKNWLKLVDKKGIDFGVVKYEKPPKHGKKQMVSTHYQLINTLDLTYTDIQLLVQESIDRINEMMLDPQTMLDYCCDYVTEENNTLQTKKELIYKLLNWNREIASTSFYANITQKIREELRGNIKHGRLLVNGNYSTLCGNPIEMLQEAIGQFKGESIIGVGNIVCKRFDVDTSLLVCRSPHITMGNLYVPTNTHNDLINKYMNFTNEILALNSINENTLQRLQGCDFDSDSALVTDNKILVESAKWSCKMNVPYNAVDDKANPKEYTASNLAELDHKTSVNLIGEIVNLSQLLNSVYWDVKSHKENRKADKDAYYSKLANIYKDICTLSVMSGIEIDKAKKVFAVDSKEELAKIRAKYSDCLYPKFFKAIDKSKVAKKNRKTVRSGYDDYNCSMNRLYTEIQGRQLENAKGDKDIIDLVMGTKDRRNINYDQANIIIALCIKRFNDNIEISKSDKEERADVKFCKNEDFFNDFKEIAKQKIGSNTIRYCIEQFREIKSNYCNSLTELLLLALINCKEDTAIKVLRKN